MKRIIVALLAALAATTVTGAAFANTSTPIIDRRQALQHAAIQEGMRSGELTPGERARLLIGQQHIRRMEWHAKADGHVGPYERRAIWQAQDQASRRIYRLKHNAQRW